jgi:hypothetical protein
MVGCPRQQYSEAAAGGATRTASGVKIFTERLSAADDIDIDTLHLPGGPGVHAAAADRVQSKNVSLSWRVVFRSPLPTHHSVSAMSKAHSTHFFASSMVILPFHCH